MTINIDSTPSAPILFPAAQALAVHLPLRLEVGLPREVLFLPLEVLGCFAL